MAHEVGRVADGLAFRVAERREVHVQIVWAVLHMEEIAGHVLSRPEALACLGKKRPLHHRWMSARVPGTSQNMAFGQQWSAIGRTVETKSVLTAFADTKSIFRCSISAC